MRDDPHHPQARSAALVRRLVRDFMGRHWRRLALALLCMAVAGGSTALRAWLMEPVLDRIFIAKDSSLLLLIAGAALALAVVKSLADYGQTVLMNRVGQRVITDVQTAMFARLIRSDLAYFHAHPSGIADLALHERRLAAAQRGGQCARRDRQGRADRRFPCRRDVLPGLVDGARRLYRLAAGDPAGRPDRPPHAARFSQHAGRDRAS